MEYTIKQIAGILEGEVVGDPKIKVRKLSKIEEGGAGTLTFLANPKYEPYIYTTTASAVIVNKSFEAEKEIAASLIKVDDSYSAFAKLLEFYNKNKHDKKGISRKAKIARSATIGKNVYIGDFVSVGEHVIIGDNTKIYSNVSILQNAKIGGECILHPGSIVMDYCEVGNKCILHPGAIIGSDGFGFAPVENGQYMKIPQTGNVIIEDDVEIGANSTIDRATMGSTIIRKGCKIDNLIQIGHNCEIGSDTVVAGQTGISGSTKIGSNCMIGGQTGIAGHLKIGNKVMIAAKSGVSSNIADGEMVMGAPSFNAREYKVAYVHFKNLSTLAKKVKQLEAELKNIKKE